MIEFEKTALQRFVSHVTSGIGTGSIWLNLSTGKSTKKLPGVVESSIFFFASVLQLPTGSRNGGNTEGISAPFPSFVDSSRPPSLVKKFASFFFNGNVKSSLDRKVLE